MLKAEENLNFLAVDLGSSSGKMFLATYDGHTLKAEPVHSFENGGISVLGDDYWDILYLFQQIKKGIKKAHNRSDNTIQGIGIDTWGVDYGLLDSRGHLLTNPYHYRDNRTDGIINEVVGKMGKKNIYSQTGIEFIWFNTLYQLYADQKYRPWILDRAEALLFTPDLINYFLCGEKFNEYTIASTSQMFNPIREDWAYSIFKGLDLPFEIMQDIIYPGQMMAEVSDDIKKECGLKESLQVNTVGSHDTQSALAAVPFDNPANSAFLSSGSWCLLGVELEKPLINNESLKKNFTNECGVEKKTSFMKNLSGLWLIQECRRVWNSKGQNLDYDEIDRAAYEAEADMFRIDPNDESFKNPQDMTDAVKDFCRRNGQPVPENYGQMARGIYESLAESYKEVIEDMEEMLNQKIETINIVGGGSQSEILCELTAEITGRRVIVGPVEATALGNALVQLMARGEIENLKQGRELIRQSVELKEYN